MCIAFFVEFLARLFARFDVTKECAHEPNKHSKGRYLLNRFDAKLSVHDASIDVTQVLATE